MAFSLPFKFNPVAAAHVWVGRKAARWLDEVFLLVLGGQKIEDPKDPEKAVIALENFRLLIKGDRNILSLFPPEAIAFYRANLHSKFPVDKQLLDSFSDEEVRSWVPKPYLDIAASETGGEAWLVRQLADIRAQLLASPPVPQRIR